tara:strand:+ start:3573 stop:3749 length:177 start_codon:yes stop_codon:yes gene_type:complete
LILLLPFLLAKKEIKKASLTAEQAGPDSILSFYFSKLNFGRMISLVPQELSDLSKALL